MAHLSYHAGKEGKVQKNQVKASLRHTQRLTYGAYYKHGNKDIDRKMTKYNRDYEFQGVPVEDAIEDALEMRYKAKTKTGKKQPIRKDAAVIREIIVQPSSDVFLGLTILQKQEKMEKFVKDARPWIEKEFGKKNLLGASTHLDETNPHVHFMVIPLTKDGRLSQKDFFKGPGHFHLQHKDFREHMNNKGWNFDLENKYEGAKGVSLKALKANGAEIEQNRQEMTDLIRENEILTEQNKKMAEEMAETPEIKEEALDIAVQQFLTGGGTAVYKKLREEIQEEVEGEVKGDRKFVAERYHEAMEKMELAERMIALVTKAEEEAPKLPTREELQRILEDETDKQFSVMVTKTTKENVLVDLRGDKPRKISERDLIKALTTVETDDNGRSYLEIEGSAPISYVLGYYSAKEPKTAKKAHTEGMAAIATVQNEMALEIENERTL